MAEKEFSLKDWLLHYRSLLILFFIYFFLSLPNLTLLPPYNDESIYIDWAWSYTHMPGHLYDSLLDAKQPLMIWIFAFFQNFFSDPLYAGRFVSVLFGSLTMLGVYVVSKILFNKQTAFLAALVYAVTPIFIFYNRQALMEASIACVGIWGFYALLRLVTQPTQRNGVLLGIILGIGFFIKSSSLLFIAAASIIILFYIFRKQKKELIKPSLISILSFFGATFLLFINPLFWQTFSTNNRYTYTFAELLTFPFSSWLNHLSGVFEIGVLFITPVVFICGILGIYLIKKEKIKYHQLFFFYFIFSLALEIFSGRYQNQRYLVPFLVFLVITAAFVFYKLWKGVLWQKLLIIVAFVIPFSSSLLLTHNPDYYIMQMSKFSTYSNREHIRGQMSGYGIKEVMEYIKDHSVPAQPTMVLFALNAGNPESAIDVYSNKDPGLYALRIDARFFPGIEQYECLTSKYPMFFVTRYDQRVGMDQFFVLEKSFLNPDGKYSIGIYTLKKDCKGKSASLSDFYEAAMLKISQIRSGTTTSIPQL
jgi:hypothetical protein